MGPVNISLSSLGKKFGSEWIFRRLSSEINFGEKILISGGNGSGKSTLLQVISGYVTPNEGSVNYTINGISLQAEDQNKFVSFASPYLHLIEDFTLAETIEHTALFKPFIEGLSTREVIKVIELSHADNKFIKQFSSGMKQRLKLGLAILSNTPVVLLDEPISNLDKAAISWYKNLISQYTAGRTVMVCSNNIEDEHFFCTRSIEIGDFKIKKTSL